MVQRSYYKVLIVVAFALGVVLTIIYWTQGRFSLTAFMRDSREPAGNDNALQNVRREAISTDTRHQALLPAFGPAVPDPQSGDEDESPGQSSANVAPLEKAAQKAVQGGKETAKARASKPVAKPKLVASSTTVKESERGPVATFQFRPTTTEPIGQVMIVAFLPPGSDAKILDLSPTASTAFSGVDKRISENGWFAAFMGTPQEVTNYSFHLSVSQPVITTIKGNCGIEPFEIDLRPSR